MLTLRGADGDLAILAGHIPFITSVQPCDCKIELEDGSEKIGHTHGGQYSFFGVRPTEYTYTEDCGLYQEGNSYLYVTKGIGALIPFRFAVSPEIVVITLHRK